MIVSKKISFILLIIAACLLTVFSVAGSLFASQKPVAEIYLGEDKASTPMFKEEYDGLWYPGKTAKGTFRIHNRHPFDVQIEQLSLNMELENSVGNQDKELRDNYAKNMLLKIRKGSLPVFNKTIYDGNFYGMLYDGQESEFHGFTLPKNQRITIKRGDSIDLEYTVQMDENAGNELQGLIAVVDFNVRIFGSEGDNGNGGKGHHWEYRDLDHWAHDCIITLLKHGVITGYPDNTIRPNNHITRAEAASIVYKGLRLELSSSYTNPYVDNLPEWARNAILSNSEKGIFVGYPQNLFKANQYITREEMTCILIKAFEHKLDDSKENIEITFVDKDQISPWAEKFVLKAVQNDILSGYPDKTYKPRDNITRAEAFTIICKLLGYHNEHTDEVYQGE
ncbi:MAG TPA: S-layer homology domain-containing protein [Clostridia bacterium]|nr:S-layer homology domain-containing protein [Clostridia bacterium]